MVAAMVEAGRIFEHFHGEFFAALEDCRVRPRTKAVHQLRTTARRLEALLATAKRRQPVNRGFGRKVDKALKALQPVRKAAGPVRDVDVQLGLLEELLETKGASLPPEGRSVVSREARTLQAKLERRREDAAVELMAVIRASEDKELRRISPLQTGLTGTTWMSLLKNARSVERSSAQGLKTGDPVSLHEYRKRAKSARYLAEMDKDSAVAERFAKRMKKVLDAIGTWHDWLLLTQLAKETGGKSSALANEMKKQRDGALRRAVRGVERLHRQA
jgi:CHAD domain-containing protein